LQSVVTNDSRRVEVAKGEDGSEEDPKDDEVSTEREVILTEILFKR